MTTTATAPRTLPAPTQRIVPEKFAHVVLKTANFDAVIEWYATRSGLRRPGAAPAAAARQDSHGHARGDSPRLSASSPARQGDGSREGARVDRRPSRSSRGKTSAAKYGSSFR